jgi:hypothetical protein
MSIFAFDKGLSLYPLAKAVGGAHSLSPGMTKSSPSARSNSSKPSPIAHGQWIGSTQS